MITAAPPPPAFQRPAPARRRLGANSRADRARLWIAAGVALALHAAVYFLTKDAVFEQAKFGMDAPAPTMDVELVAGDEAAAAEATPEPPAPTPEPEPPPMPEEVKPEPVPEPPPVPEPAKEEMIAPTPEPPKPTPPPAPKPVAKPRVPAKPSAAPATQPPAAAGTVTAPGGIGTGRGGRSSGPGYLYNPRPPYPAESRAAGEQGVTTVRVLLDPAGRATKVTLVRSSGHPRLDRATMEAVRRWRFKPATSDGRPIASSVDVPMRWNLRN